MNLHTHRAGVLDPTFGDNGIAPLTLPIGHRKFEPLSCYTEPDGSMVYYGHAAVAELPAEQTGFYFGRLTPDGTPTEAAPVHRVACPVSTSNYDFTVSRTAVNAGILGFSLPVHPVAKFARYRSYIGISRFAEDFTPLPEFGDNGIVIPLPIFNDSLRPAGSSTSPCVQSNTAQNRLADNIGLPRGAVIGKRIRVVFQSFLIDNENTEIIDTTTLLASFDSATGKPISDIGENHDAETVALPERDGEALEPTGAHFYDNGSFVLLAVTSASTYLMRFHANGQLDDGFADGQPIKLPLGVLSYLAVSEKRLVVTIPASPLPLGGGTTVYAFDKDGTADREFNLGQPLTLADTDATTLTLYNAVIDEDERIILSGGRWSVDSGLSSECHVTRLLNNGTLDPEFADNGHFRGPEGYQYGEAVFVNDDGIRIVCSAPGFESIAKLTN